MAAYITGLLIGNGNEGSANEVEESIGSYGKLAELVLFLSMGLVVDPVKVLVFLPWILLLAVLMLLVRLVVVFLLLGKSFTNAQKQFLGFCGLRGAVPIALAIQAAADHKLPAPLYIHLCFQAVHEPYDPPPGPSKTVRQ